MCTHYLQDIHPSKHFPHILTPPTVTNSPRKDLVFPQISDLLKKKQMTVLFKITIRWVSSWHSHIYKTWNFEAGAEKSREHMEIKDIGNDFLNRT
jgi:hypothetical protein